MTDLAGIVVLGLAAGAIYGLAGTGLVLTFSTSGIFNFGHGAVAAVGAYSFHEATVTHGVHWVPALLGCTVLVGVVCGLLLERMARRLARAPLHLRVVATVALILIVEGAVQARYGTTTLFADRFVPGGAVTVLGVRVGIDRFLILVFGAGAVMALQVLLVRSRLGLAMRAVVDDPGLLAETGTDPAMIRRVSWVLGSSLAAVSGILLAPSIGLEPVVLTFLVIQAFGAAAIGRFASPVGTFVGGLAIGVATALTTRYLGGVSGLSGLPASIPFLVLLAALLVAPPDRLVGEERGIRPRRPRRQLPALGLASAVGAAVVGVVAIPTLAGPRLPVFTNGAALLFVFLSLSLLVNGSGQVSLCHAAFAAVGATAFAHLTTGAGLPWGVALVSCGLITVPLGVAVAVPAARLSSLALAIATFGFGLVVERLLYGRGLMFGSSGTRLVPRPEFVGLNGDRAYFFLVAGLAVVATTVVALALRGRLGRLLTALADDPRALAATGASVAVSRVVVFSLSAFLAGIGGALAAAGNGSVTTVTHPPMQSLLLVAVLAIGGRGPISAGVRATAGLALVPVYFEWLIGTQVSLAFGATAVAVAMVRCGSASADPVLRGLVDASSWRLERGPVQSRVPTGTGARA